MARPGAAEEEEQMTVRVARGVLTRRLWSLPTFARAVVKRHSQSRRAVMPACYTGFV